MGTRREKMMMLMKTSAVLLILLARGVKSMDELVQVSVVDGHCEPSVENAASHVLVGRNWIRTSQAVQELHKIKTQFLDALPDFGYSEQARPEIVNAFRQNLVLLVETIHLMCAGRPQVGDTKLRAMQENVLRNGSYIEKWIVGDRSPSHRASVEKPVWDLVEFNRFGYLERLSNGLIKTAITYGGSSITRTD